MKKTFQIQKILESVSGISEAEKTFKNLLENLEKIQKSLLDYLERQWSAFPWFYFIGDDDLLEIIGNSKDITRIQSYFSKMFAGINFVQSEENG